MKARWRLFRARGIHGSAASALVTFGETVVALGDPAEVAGAFPQAEPVDLSGHLVPGFNDAHMHPTMTAENLLHVDASPEAVRSPEELAAALRAATGDWVVAARYDHAKTTGGQIVDRRFLDAAVPDRPALLIHVAAHWGVLNSRGLAAAGLTDSTSDPRGGALGRDASGALNGIVYEQALFDIAYPSLSRGPALLAASPVADRLESLARAQAMFHAAGITSVTDALCGPDEVALLSEADRRGLLTLRTNMLVAHPHVDKVDALGLRAGFGSTRLRLLGVKAFVDGACAGGTCWVDEPFVGTSDHGIAVVDQEELDDLAVRVSAAGLVLGVHANGDRAIRMLLTAHERARAAGTPAAAGPRHRIEHCTIVDDDILARIRALGLVAVPFGAYARFHGDKLVGYYGAERLNRMFAHRSFLDEGIAVAGSSDFPCGPYEPLAALTSCVTRRAFDGTDIGPAQRISAAEAIAVYTEGSAFSTGEEQVKGRLEPGMLADFVELSDDPLAVPGEQVETLKVRSTWVGAENVYAA